jgi:PIN domain nuclease of toxin-antitoxin system
MRLLIDTHIAIWASFEQSRLPPAARKLLETSDSVWVSAASIWEIAIKHALYGKRVGSAFPMSGREAIVEFELAGFQRLDITADHAAMVDTLPRHHGDPFDRMLVAQALAEPLRLVTADKALAAYGEIVITV